MSMHHSAKPLAGAGALALVLLASPLLPPGWSAEALPSAMVGGSNDGAGPLGAQQSRSTKWATRSSSHASVLG